MSTKLQQQIADLKTEAADLAKEHEPLKARVQKVINDISDPLRAGNAALIKRHLDALNTLMPTYAAVLASAKSLATRLENTKADDERSDEHKALVALTGAVAELKGRMERNYLALKGLQDKANDALASTKAAGSGFAQEWAEMEAWMDAQVKLANLRFEQIKSLHELALGSVAARDSAELAQLQRRNDERTGWKPTPEDVNIKLINFFGKGEPKLSQDLRDQATRDRVKFDKSARDIAEVYKKIDGYFTQIKALKIKPIDLKKAATLLEIPGKFEGKLQKALDAGDQMDRALGALAKEAGLKASGADMVGKLKKAKLV